MPLPRGWISKPPILIDLTGDLSDTGDEGDIHMTTKGSHISRNRVPGARPLSTSHPLPHGLPVVSNVTSTDSKNGKALGTNSMVNSPAPGTLQSGSTNAANKTRQDGASRTRVRRTDLQLLTDSIENISADRHSAKILPPNSSIKRQKISHDGGVLKGASIPPQLPQTRLQQLRHSSLRPPVLMTGKTVVAKSSRSASGMARVSIEGKIQKLRALENNMCDEQSVKILKQQVIPHIKDSMRPYRNQLLKDERTNMGSRIASMLVNNPSFVKHLRINKERLPSEYERLLAVEAKQLASQYFKELKNTNRTALSAAVTSNEVRPAVDRMTSESTDTEQTFESHLQPLGGIPGILSRGRSFSSVTSFSNDTVEITSPVDSSTGFEDSAAKGTRTLPKRSSRAVQPLYARAKPRRSRRKPNTQRSIAVTPPRIVARSENTTQNESTSYDQKREQGTKSYSRDAVSPLKPATRIERDSATEVAVHGTAPAHKGVSTREFLDPIGYLLIQRELHGMTPVRAQRGQSSFKAVASSYFEDCFVRQSEWTDCSGTILSLTWTSPSAFICGAVAHSDCNHMQYNKPGNLLLGSVNHDTLRAYPDHRLIRPIVSAAQNESNSLEAMRQTQDPWMYSPVVATAHSEKNGYTFTASFDKTVKIWTLTESGSSMKLQGTWVHDDKVNFVAASPHHDRVATASQSMSNAVRVYSLDEDAISESAYDQYCGNKASVQAEEVQRREKWAYYPSTIQWGRAECVKHLLLVGWSPRSDSGDDCDIPDEKRNTGELCLWDILDSSRVPITSAHLQNVFEVIWHPTQPCFLAATSPAGNFDADVTKTQIRLFGQNSYGSFLNNRTFDCPAWDVNELTIMPTSPFEYFITVSCTDRRTYVYDSKRGDAPIHILQHGNSLDEPENEDSGVKFACWGNSPDRFYTGSSDGELIAWNVKAPVGGAHVRTLLRLTGGIYAGSFSKDFSKLIIGDDTGKVHLLAIDDSDLLDPTLEVGDLSLSRMTPDNLVPVKFNRPKLVIPHPEPPPPNADNINIMQDGELSTLQISSRYLERGQLRLFPNSEFPRARKAIYQGPNYSETLLYRFEAHEDYDSTQPLLAKFLEKQQFIVDEQSYRKEQIQEKEKELRLQTIRPPRIPWQEQKAHRANINLDLDFRNLSLSTQRSFNRERVEFEGDFVFDYELMPSDQHVFLGG